MQRIGTDGSKRIKKIIFEILWIVAVLALVFVDQIVKRYVKGLHDNDGWSSSCVISGFFNITYAFNTGAAWSFLANVSWGQTFFKILTIFALCGFIVYYIFAIKSRNLFLRITIILIISGILGNFIDRLFYGGVVDFFSFIFGSYHFPIFNIADSYLTVGVILLFVNYLFVDKNAIFKAKENGKNKTDS